jgi:hypothetical protein
VIISYAAPQKFGGGTVTTSGSNVIHTFTTSGTLTPISSLSASYLIVAGGGAGGPLDGGGGGAGGMQTGSGVTIDTNSVYVVTVGAGGAGATYPSSGGASPANSGSNSLFSAYVTASVGGGGGGSMTSSFSVPQNGGTGGSGGGGSYGAGAVGGSGTSGQGNKGGDNNGPAAGGGGGAGAAGSNGVSLTQGGAGGIGLQSSISGTATYYAGGGGGAADPSSTTQALGGLGGGGNSAYSRANNGTAGTANTGGGGGGGVGGSGLTGYSGGSGIVIISYAGSQQMAGGTVTSVGGNTIHTFTSSGYLTPLKLVPNSLRFRSSASAYLNRTPSSATNQNTWTLSGWYKRGIVSGPTQGLFGAGQSGSNTAQVYFGYDVQNSFAFIYYTGSFQTKIETNQVFRDPSAWYHFVLTYDSTQATSTNRVKMYVNGVQITSLYSTTYPSQNQGTTINSATYHSFANNVSSGTQNYDGYLGEVNFIDGQSLTPNSFGTFNSYGVWQPISYGGSYGTNGFYLPFTNKTSTTTLGYDFSPNGNNWTTNNISLTAGSTYDSMTDVPTLTSATAANYCVMNPLNKGSNINLTNGNLQYDNVTSDTSVFGTIGMSSGKWYWEMTVTNNGCSCGISSGALPTSSAPGGSATGYAYNYDGRKVNNASLTSYGASYTTGDVIGYAFDADAGTITCYKNNTSQGTMFSGLTNGPYFASAGNAGSGAAYNFGQQPFVYTPPSGFVALNTYNIAAGTVTTSGTFTGNASTNGPFVYLNGAPLSLTINGNAVTFGTQANKTANGFQVITSSSSYNASGSNTYTVVTAGSVFKRGNAQPNP